jgi:tetratricopeptide (TPR) repeat protein
LANLNLGYLIYSQNMFEKALELNRYSLEGADPKLELLTTTQLGHTYKLQDQYEMAVQAFVRALELESTPEIASEVSKLYMKLGNPTLALEYASYALEMATTNVLQMTP